MNIRDSIAGDGGVLHEVAKHPGVQEIHMCEIDQQVLLISSTPFVHVVAGKGGLFVV